MENSLYDSNNGFMTKIWGPMMWSFLHIMSFNYPVEPSEEQKHHYFDFVMNLQNTLPCGACRKNVRKNIQDLTFTIESDMKSRDSFSRWVYRLHNKVNEMLGKPHFRSFEEVRFMYNNFRARCGQAKGGKKENGCVVPENGVRSKCFLVIAPEKTTDFDSSFLVSRSCGYQPL